VNGVVVCGEVVDVLWDDRAGFYPLELVYTYEAVIYDSGDSVLSSLERVRGWTGGGVGVSIGFKSSVEDYVTNVIDHS
jgi:hypothetical protein